MQWWRAQSGETRRLRKGDPYQNLLDETVETPAGCWEVQGRLNDAGYAVIWVGGKRSGGDVRAHRISYERNIGPIPDGLVVDHICKNRACINPEHLRLLTPPDNSRANTWALRDRCSRGHPYDEENTRYLPDTSRQPGTRVCRACARESARASRARKRSRADS